jgi:type I restriction enzyme, S subunit
MSGMNFLEKLLDGVAVEWKTLGDVSLKTSSGGTPLSTREDYYGGDIPWLRTQEVCFNEIYDTDIKITELAVKNSSAKWIPANCVIVAISGATAARSAINKIPLTTNQHCCNLEINPAIANYRYVFHWVLREHDKLKALGQGARADLNSGIIKSYQIPIPCPDNHEKSLAIQAEIVRILDTFTELTAELTAELIDRKKQYEYYRDRLLTFEEGEVEWKTLGEVFQMRAGQHISASKIMQTVNDKYIYPCFGGNGVRGFVNENSHDGAHLLIGRQGALCGNVQRMKGRFYATEHAVVVTSNDRVNIDWAFHMLTVMNLNQYASQSAQPGLAVGKLQDLKIPIPSLEEQVNVASILDKFDTLTTSISEGLPREIALRQKQYEYYRDLLLTFPKPEEQPR